MAVHVVGFLTAASRYLDFLHRHAWYEEKAETASPSMTRPQKSHGIPSAVLYCVSNRCPPRNKGREIRLLSPPSWRSGLLEKVDRSYLEISGKHHLPQIPAEGRSTRAVVRSPSLNSIRKRGSECASGITLASDTVGADYLAGQPQACRTPWREVGSFEAEGALQHILPCSIERADSFQVLALIPYCCIIFSFINWGSILLAWADWRLA